MKSPLGYLNKLKAQANRGLDFVKDELWRLELPPLRTVKGMLFRLLRILHLVVKGFREDQIRLHAMSLTYSSLMSLVPLLALGLAVLRGLGYDTRFVDQGKSYLEEMPVQFQDFVSNTLDTVNQTDFAKLGGIGALILLFMVVQVLGRIESSFNRVWGIEKARSWMLRITNYISVVVIVPILLVAAITVTASLRMDSGLVAQLGLLRLAPFFATWVAFSFLYRAMPNTRVHLWPTLISGFIGAVMWQLWFRGYITLQPGVTRYNVLYGTLASVPIFLAWLFISWIIVLLGAKVAFAVQNGTSYRDEHVGQLANARARLLIVLEALAEMARALEGKASLFRTNRFSERHHVPPVLLEQLLGLLAEAGIITESADRPGTFVLLAAPDRIEASEIARLILERGEGPGELNLNRFDKTLDQTLEKAFSSMDLGVATIADLARSDLDHP